MKLNYKLYVLYTKHFKMGEKGIGTASESFISRFFNSSECALSPFVLLAQFNWDVPN